MTQDTSVGEYTPDQSIEMMNDTMNKFLAVARVEAAYGKPTQVGDTTIIPAAEVVAAMGFGMGSGTGINEDEEGKNTGGGSGGGGGGKTFSRPVAVIIASPDGVRVEPVVDVTKIGIAALTAAGFMVGMLARMLGGPRRFK